MSANQSKPDIVLLDRMWDRNGQRAPVDDRETKRSARGTQSYKWLRDRVALQTWRASAHHIQQWKKTVGPQCVAVNKKNSGRCASRVVMQYKSNYARNVEAVKECGEQRQYLSGGCSA
jgi:hypothetical protein